MDGGGGLTLALQALMVAPILFIAIDVLSGTHLMHKGFPANGYTGGYVNIGSILNGPAGIIFLILKYRHRALYHPGNLGISGGFDKTLTSFPTMARLDDDRRPSRF